MDIMIKNESGDTIVNPDVVKVILANGYYVLDEHLVNELYLSDYELAKLKIKISNGELVEVHDGKVNRNE